MEGKFDWFEDQGVTFLREDEDNNAHTYSYAGGFERFILDPNGVVVILGGE